MPTCVSARCPMKRFVKGLPVDERNPNPVAWPSCAPFFYFRVAPWEQTPCLSPTFTQYVIPQWLARLLFSSSPPCRDNQAYVKTTCSFDSHQLISDPIKPNSAIVRPSKCLKSAFAGERACTLYPANHSWHSCKCCHGLGSEVVKTLSVGWLGENGKGLEGRLPSRWPADQSTRGGKCRQVRNL